MFFLRLHYKSEFNKHNGVANNLKGNVTLFEPAKKAVSASFPEDLEEETV